jgi:MFS family permease
MALSNFALFGGSFLTPVIVGKLTQELGWRWPFYLVAIISGVVFPLASSNYKIPVSLVHGN